MAIVGTAFVRLRVIGDKLKNDIAKATSESVEASAPSLQKSGEDVGEKISDGIGESLNRSVGSKMGKVADDIGEAIGRRMAENMSKTLRSRAGDAFSRGFANIRQHVTQVGEKAKGAWSEVSTQWGKDTGKNFGKSLRGALTGAIAFAITALPSMIAFTGAIAGALVATLIPAIGMIGPVAAGAAVAALSAFATIKLSAGLLGLAMKTETAALADFQTRFQGFKDSIGTPIQAGLLSGFNAALRIAQPIIAAIQPQLREMGFVVGDIAIGFADAFRQGAMLERLQRILTVNNDALRLSGAGATGLAQAFAVLVDHLSPFILYLASGVRDLGEWANRSILAAEASGRLDTFLNNMFTAMTRFVGILVDFGVGIFNVFRAASGESASMMTSLEGIALRFREWTGDPANQDRMAAFFEKMRIISARVLEIFGQLSVASGRALEGTDVNSVLTGLNTLVTVGKAVGTMFEDIRAAAGPQLTLAFSAFGNMLTKLADSGVLGQLSTMFALLFNTISQALDIPGVAQLLTLILGLGAFLKVAKVLMVVLKPARIIFTILRIALVALAGVIGWLPIIIGALVLALIWFFTQTEIGRDIVAAVWDFIKNAISSAVDGIVAAWNWMVDVFQSVWNWVRDIATEFRDVLLGIFNAIATGISFYVNAWIFVITTAMNVIKRVFTTVWNAIWGFIEPIITGIWSFIQTAFGMIVNVIQAYLNILWQIWIRIWPVLALPIRVLIGVIILIFQVFYDSVVGIFTGLWNFLTWVWDGIVSMTTAAVGALVDFVSWAWNGMVGLVSAGMDAIWSVIVAVWNMVWGFIRPILQTINNGISIVWNAITGTISAGMNAIWAVVTAVWNTVWGFISGILNTINTGISIAWNRVTEIIGNAMDEAKRRITNVWNDIKSFISGAMDFIKGLVSGAWEGLGDLGGGVLKGLKTAMNTVIDGVNTIIGGLNSAINLANKLPGPDIAKIPEIPRLAKGGIVSPAGGGTVALIAEAGRRERVEPLDSSGLSQRDRAMIAQLAGSGGSPNVHVYLGVRELTELVDIVVDDRENGLAGRVLTGTKG